MENIYKKQIEEGAKSLEALNQEAENAASAEEREDKLAEAGLIEEQLDFFETELGVDKDEVLKIYESINPELAEAELAESAPEVVEALANNDKEGAMIKLKNLPGVKLIRAAALFLALFVGAQTVQAGEYHKWSSQNPKSWNIKWPDRLEDLKQWRDKYSLNLSDETLEDVAKSHTRLDKFCEAQEDNAGVSGLNSAIKALKRQQKKTLEEEAAIKKLREELNQETAGSDQNGNKNIHRKGITSSGAGADEDAW